MKRLMCGLLVAGMTLACAPTAFAKSKITVNVDKDELVFDVEPQIINDRLMVPMRVIFEKLDAKVDYIASEKAVVSQKGDKTIRFVINSDYMEITDGNSETKKIALDSPATIIDGRTLVPARAVAESFGCGVSWDGNTRTVQINTDGSTVKPEPKKEGKWVVTKETDYLYDKFSAQWESYWYEYEYDSAGHKTKSTYYNLDGNKTSWTKYEYDSAGNMTKETEYSSDGSVSDQYGYEYDSAGKLTKTTYYITYGNKNGMTTKYEYDSAGNNIKATRYLSDGSENDVAEYEYDGAGNMTKATQYFSNGQWSWCEYEYDSTGKMTKKINHENMVDGIYGWNEYEYDSAGKMTKDTEYNGNGSVYSYTEYEYDNAGNLTKETTERSFGDNDIGHDRKEYEYKYISIE